ncbi:hypothetical protein ACWGPQ_21915 [Saccharomonospora azurea]
MRTIDTDRLRELADHRPGLIRRALSNVVFHLVDIATGIAVGSVIGLLFLASGLTGLWAVLIGMALAAVTTRLSIRSWERAAGLTRVRTTSENDEDDVELADTDDPEDTDVDDVATAEPARTSDSPEVAAAR